MLIEKIQEENDIETPRNSLNSINDNLNNLIESIKHIL